MLEHTLGPAIDSTVLLHGFKPACFLLLFLWHPLWLLQPCQIVHLLPLYLSVEA